MKEKMICSILIFVLIVFFIDCSTVSTITTYDEKGNIIKVEKIEKGAVDKLMESVKDKTLIIWRSGWAGYISASPATIQDPTPTFKIFAGKMDEGYISINKENKDLDWKGISEAISATNKSLKISAKGMEEK